jgi:hypothetical protein
MMQWRGTRRGGLRGRRRLRACPTTEAERGSALLVMLVFAAIIAIMLYRELPVAAFEARRAKEQLLVDRGHEYQRAVQLYYRKFRGQYPASFEQLESTNNMRFLRRRYKDPFTGKDDWRLLHAGGPNGMLIDSKVNPMGVNGQGQNGQGQNGQSQSGQGAANGFSSFSNSSTASFGGGSTLSQAQNGGGGAASNSFPGFPGASSIGSSDGTAEVTVPAVRARGPAVAATGGNGASDQTQTPTSSELAQDPSTPLLPPTTGDSSGNPSGAPNNNGVSNANGAPAPSGAPAANGSTPNAMQSVQNLFNSGPNLPTQATQTAASTIAGAPSTSTNGVSTSGSSGQLHSGGLAGVASRAEGKTIKTVNDQTNYSLWEFWYDPTKDTSMGQNSNLQNGNGGQNVQNGTQPGQPAANGTGFNSNNSTDASSGSTNAGVAQQGTGSPATAVPVSPTQTTGPQSQ